MLTPPAAHASALALAFAAVASTLLATRAYQHVARIRQHDQVITVTGSSRRRIRSDLAVWRAHVSARAPTLAAAYDDLSRQLPRVRAHLEQQGVAPTEIVSSAVATHLWHPRDARGLEMEDQVSAYELTQTVEVTSTDVDRVARVARDVTALIEAGVTVSSDEPRYLYTRLADLKIRLLADATRDARLRAEQIATHTRSRLGALSTGRMGVIQVNAANETEVSAEGVNDDTSLEKDAMAVVSAAFYVE